MKLTLNKKEKKMRSYGAWVLLLAVVSSACSTPPRVMVRTPDEEKQLAAENAPAPKPAGPAAEAAPAPAPKEKPIDDQYQDTFNACYTVGVDLRDKMHRSSTADLSITTVGIVAGSIVVPALAAKAAAKSVIAAWGGVSGSANAYQYAKNQEGLGAAQYAAIYTAMTNKMIVAMNAYAAAGTDRVKMRAAINQLVLACQFPSSAEIVAMSAPRPPDAPMNAIFHPTDTSGTSGKIEITPPVDDRGMTIIDYKVTITPAGPVAEHADFRNPKVPTVELTKLTKGTSYQALIQSVSSAGEGPPLVYKMTP